MQTGIKHVIPRMFSLGERCPPSHSQSLLPRSDILILDRVERDADRFRLGCPCRAGVRLSGLWRMLAISIRLLSPSSCRICHGRVFRSNYWATAGRFRCRNPSCPRKMRFKLVLVQSYGDFGRVPFAAAVGKTLHHNENLGISSCSSPILKTITQLEAPSGRNQMNGILLMFLACIADTSSFSNTCSTVVSMGQRGNGNSRQFLRANR